MSTRSTRWLAAAVCILGSWFFVAAHAPGQNAEPKPDASKLMQAASGALDAASTMYDVGQADAEEVYRWSRRLLDAELRAGGGADFALQHVARMRNLHKRAETLNRAGLAGGEELTLRATEFYLEEAQLIALEHAQP